MSETHTRLAWGVGDDDVDLDALDDLYEGSYPDALTRGDNWLGAEVAELDGLYALDALAADHAEETRAARAAWDAFRASCLARLAFDPGPGALLLRANEST